ncbi:MAG: hypothetical protein GF398_06775 [Chitinivibrionales bacterium]|nr:hypothetical protein [Chitinivibrionales bacterium]
MNQIHIRGVFLGIAADWGITIAFAFIIQISYAVYWHLQGLDQAAIAEKIVALAWSTQFNLFFLPFGLAFTVFGGYIATRTAQSDNLINAALMGSTSIALGMVIQETGPMWVQYIGIIATVPMAILGGYLYTGAWNFFLTRQS